jgi:hypothetical protein
MPIATESPSGDTTPKDWRDESLTAHERVSAFIAFYPGLLDAALEEGCARIDAALKVGTTRTEEEEHLFQADRERFTTLWRDLATGKSTITDTMRQYGARIVLDASSADKEAVFRGLRGLCGALAASGRKVIARANEISILGSDRLPGWVRNEDYSDANPSALELVIILSSKNDRAHFAGMHQLVHRIVALAWAEARKPALFVMGNSDCTRVYNAAEECLRSDQYDRESMPGYPDHIKCRPDVALRIYAAARPPVRGDYGRPGPDYAGVIFRDGASDDTYWRSLFSAWMRKPKNGGLKNVNRT